MTFTWLNKQGVESDGGFILQRMHRYYYHYIVADHVMLVKVEPGIKDEQILLASLSTWQPPHDTEAINSDAKNKIRSHIAAALDFMKIRYRFV